MSTRVETTQGEDETMEVANPVADETFEADRPSPEEVAPDWRDEARAKLELARAWVQEHPVAALGIALGTGFVVGRVFRR